MYRPQFTYPDPPPGFEWQPCAYEFDTSNTPALFNLILPTGQLTGYIPLRLDNDAPFVLASVEIQSQSVNFELRDPWTNDLVDFNLDPLTGALVLALPVDYAPDVPPAAVLEGPWLFLPPGAVLSVRLQGQ